MEEKVVLKVVLHGDKGLEIMLGKSEVNPLMLIGILEQVKMSILEEGVAENEPMSVKGPVKNQA